MIQCRRFGLVALLLWWLAGPALAADRHLLWRVDDGERHGWLFGSIHFGKPDLYPLAPVIGRAFADADALVVEIDMLALDPLEASRILLLHGVYTSPDNLRRRLEPATWQALTDAARVLGLPVALLLQQKPWLAALTLSSRVFRQAGYREDLGIDLHFLRRARDTGTPVVELESFEAQLALFERLTPDEQAAFLRQTLAELDQGTDYLEQVVAAWRSGDAPAIDRLINGRLQADEAGRHAYEILLSERNARMTETIAALLARGRTPFVVVGAGHLVGPDGIVQRLRRRSYHVEQY